MNEGRGRRPKWRQRVPQIGNGSKVAPLSTFPPLESKFRRKTILDRNFRVEMLPNIVFEGRFRRLRVIDARLKGAFRRHHSPSTLNKDTRGQRTNFISLVFITQYTFNVIRKYYLCPFIHGDFFLLYLKCGLISMKR